jgi:uncharacterized protein (TIGR02266 family)
MFRDLGAVFLARFGCVITAGSGEQALALARRERPAVIVTDLGMPGMDGEALCRAIRSDAALCETPLIAVASGDYAEERARAVRAGADDVVAKPISRMSLVQSVRHYLRAPREAGWTRVDLETAVYLRAGACELAGRSRNVSRGGICVDAERALPCATEVELAFRLPEIATPLLSTARVVWEEPAPDRSGAGMGLQFLALDRESSAWIEHFIAAHTQPAPEPPRGSLAA